MGVADRKEREKEEMRLKILNAARILFLEQGFEKTSIRNIAESIEYSPSTIYLYFKDKNELLLGLHTQGFVAMMEHFMHVMTIKDPMEKLIKLGEEYMAFAFENPELYELMFMMVAPIESLECGENIWHDGRTLIGFLEAIIEECKLDGHFKESKTEDLSMMLWGQVHGLMAIHLKRRTMMFEESQRITRIHTAWQLFVSKLLEI